MAYRICSNVLTNTTLRVLDQMAIKKILTVSILATTCWATVAIASVVEPVQLADIQYRMDMPQDIEYSKLRTRMEYNLIRGNKYEFQENLIEVEKSGDFGTLTDTYSIAVETEFADVNPKFYKKALDQYPKALILLKALGQGHGPAGYTSDQLRWVRANYFFLIKDSQSLKKMIGKHGQDDNDATYVDGFTHLLLARLDNSKRDIQEAIRLLEQVMDQMGESDKVGLRQGRLALHLSNAYLLSYSYEPASNRSETLELASYYASMARRGLELHITPLLYGRALELTADILDEMILLKDRTKGLGTTVRLRYQRDSLRNLAVQYH